MKIDVETLAVLKNFAKINPSIFVQEGNVLKTISSNKTIMAKATVPTAFEKNFGIYNLDQFIANLSLYNDPDLSFGDTKVIITDNDRTEGSYTYADENVITKAPDKVINLPSVDVSFVLKNLDLKEVEKAAGILNVPEIAVNGDGKNVYLMAFDSKNPTGNTFKIKIGETDKKFNAIFRTDNIKIIPGDYMVEICSRGISHFSTKDIEYWIAVEQSSTF